MMRVVAVLLCIAAACSHAEEHVKPAGSEPAQQTGSGAAPGAADAGTPAGAERSGGLTGVAEHPRSNLPMEVQKPQQSAASAENVRVLALAATQKALVTIAMRFTSGAIDDPTGKAGITALGARVMAEGGTQALDAKSLLVALFPMATSIDARVDKELTTFSATGLAFGTANRMAGWGQGLTILACMQNLLPALEPDERPRALYHGLSAVARDTAAEPPHFLHQP